MLTKPSILQPLAEPSVKTSPAARYAERSGRTLSNLDFYSILAYFKLAVILEDMHARFLAGAPWVRL